jgi:hypothetical protein
MGYSKGWGIKTLKNLEARAFVFEFVEEIINNNKLARQLDNNLVDGKKTRELCIAFGWGQ